MATNSYIKEKICYLVMFIVNKLVGIEKNKYFFIGMVGNYCDNSRAVSEKLREKYPDAKIYWYFSKKGVRDVHIPDYIHPVTGLVKLYLHLATSYCWITCGVINNSIYKSKKQLYIDLWHGDRGFKRILNDKEVKVENRKTVSFNTKYCDLMVSGSSFFDRIIESAFCFHGNVLHSGSPRNDILLKNNDSLIQSIKKDIGIAPEIKVLLYAPTFRDHDMNNQKENIDIERTLLAFEQATSEKWICLGRFHPMTRNKNRFTSEKIIDVTSYFDMADLLLISDAHITDYSSTAGDFVLLNRPLFLFHSDIEDYKKRDRNLYFNIDESPFWVATTQEELENLILTKAQEDVERNCDAIRRFYGVTETGHASDDVVNFIMGRNK